MFFNSNVFMFLFLPVTFFIYFFLNRKQLSTAAKYWLVLASLFFYGWWNFRYVPLLAGSLLFNYAICSRLTDSGNKSNRKLLVTIGVTVNICLLGFFKYTNFFIENINSAFNSGIPAPHILLPLGISFFTFVQISCLVDNYRSGDKLCSFPNFALFSTFFPQLISGPIVRYNNMVKQYEDDGNTSINYINIATGLYIFAIGLFKKTVIADTLSKLAASGFDYAESLSFFEAWLTSLSYTLQIYFDFSGYTDMAIGAALLFNIKLPINFNSPYKALNIQDFWRRWHITFSSFLRDYLYIPLGGNRKGDFRTYQNLLIVFLIGGLWHGAEWTFVFWGFLHGIGLVIHRLWSKLNIKQHNIISWFITFNYVNIAWIFFRAKDWPDSIKVLKGMFGLGGFVLPWQLADRLSFLDKYGVVFGGYIHNFGRIGFSTPIFIFVLVIAVALMNNSMQMKDNFKPNLKGTAIILLAFMSYIICELYLKVENEFIYFQF